MTRSEDRDFPFSFERRYRLLAWMFGINDRSAAVQVTAERFIARFGPWTLQTPRSNVKSATITGPYRMIRTAGPAHLSIADRGLTFATNGWRGVCVQFIYPVRGLEPFGLIRHPNLTVTVADVAGLTELFQPD